MRSDEMTTLFPYKRAMVGAYCALQMVILPADICAHLRDGFVLGDLFAVAETEINGAVLRRCMALGIPYPVPEPQRARTADNSAERLTFVERPQAEKSCEGVSAKDTLTRESVLLFTVWNALVHKPVQR